MIRIALILKNITRQIGHGWPLRFKSNEVGIIFNNCNSQQCERIALELEKAIADMEPVPAKDDIPAFHFSATISWAIWPQDDMEWDTLFTGNYANLLENWRAGGERIIHYNKRENNGN